MSETQPPPHGRTVYDAAVEILRMLGGAAPYAVFLVIILYAIQQVVIANNDKLAQVNIARTEALEKNAAEIARLNQIVRENADSMERLRAAQMDGIGKATELGTTITAAVLNTQALLAQQRAAILDAQSAAAAAERSLRDVEASRQVLTEDVTAMRRQRFQAEETIDAARRVLAFLGDELPPGRDFTALSRRFETVGESGMAREGSGGTYFGVFRIPGNEMADFIDFIQIPEPRFASNLREAGGATAAAEGTAAFQVEWRSLSRDRQFDHLQVAWIEERRYRRFLAALGRALTPGPAPPAAFAADTRSVALQAVLWSVVVQEGVSTPQVRRAWSGLDPAATDDHTLICAIFAERRKLGEYRPSASAETVTLLRARYRLEQREALRMLPSNVPQGGLPQRECQT